MKLNKKGFTLIELLVTIVIIGLVVGLSTYGIIKILNSTEKQKITLSESSIKDAAKIYSGEADKSSWKESNDYELFCVTIGELMNKGLLDKNASVGSNLTKDNFVVVKRNKITFAIEKEEFAKKDDSNYNICTSQVIVPSENIIKNPKITTPITSYTDKIEIPFIKGSATYNGTPSETSYRCLYGTTSSLINRQGRIEDDKCILEGLKNNTEYYAVVYMDTNHGSTVASEPLTSSTTDFVSTDIWQDQHPELIYVTYNDKDNQNTSINSPSYYFKSTVNAESDKNLYECSLDNNDMFTCSDTVTKGVVRNVWYKTNDKIVTLTYPLESNKIDITTRIYDGSNNYKEDSNYFETNKYTIKFHKNNAESIGGGTSEIIERYCITGANEKCSIFSPSIEAPEGYKVVGWNMDSEAATSTWDVQISKSIDSSGDYYAIITIGDEIINANKFSCEAANRLAVYHVTTCRSDNCIYDTKNGLNNSYNFSLDTTGTPNWAINKSNYVDSVSDKSSITTLGNTCNRQLRYVSASALNCRSEASTARGSESIKRTWNQCTALYVYRTTMKIDNNYNWFYSSTYDCFLSGQYLTSTQPASCNAATTYTIMLNNQGATTGGTENLYVKYGTGIYLDNNYTKEMTSSSNYIEVPTKTGYTFGGYYPNSDGTGAQMIDSNGIITTNFTSTTYSADTTLYAKWIGKTYTITYNANGGSGAPSKQIKKHGENLKLSGISPTKPGYKFLGWSISSRAASVNYKVNDTYKIDANAILYAVWQEIIYDYVSCPIGNVSTEDTTVQVSKPYYSSKYKDAGYVGHYCQLEHIIYYDDPPSKFDAPYGLNGLLPDFCKEYIEYKGYKYIDNRKYDSIFASDYWLCKYEAVKDVAPYSCYFCTGTNSSYIWSYTIPSATCPNGSWQVTLKNEEGCIMADDGLCSGSLC